MLTVSEGLAGLRQLSPGAVVSIGNFDGVHRGHQRLLDVARELKIRSQAPTLAVVTFEPHPLTVLRPGHAPPRLTPPTLKRELLEALGADQLVELPPAPQILDLTAEQFWQIIRDDVRPSHLVEGSSFNFGKGRRGTIDTLRQWAASSPVTLHVIDAVTVVLLDMLLVPVSSSIVRWLLENGRVRDAAICLGRPYALRGRVIAGARRGRELGVPTANLQCADQLIVADGVYAGRCTVDGKDWPAAVSIGTNPTFGQNPRTVEAHLIGFDGDLYNRTLNLELIDWQREQRVYGDVERLREQMARDLKDAAVRATLNPSRAIAMT